MRIMVPAVRGMLDEAGSQAHDFLRRTRNPRAYPRGRRDLRRKGTKGCEGFQVQVMPVPSIYFERWRKAAKDSEEMLKRPPSQCFAEDGPTPIDLAQAGLAAALGDGS
jgi:hypothetical protein